MRVALVVVLAVLLSQMVRADAEPEREYAIRIQGLAGDGASNRRPGRRRSNRDSPAHSRRSGVNEQVTKRDSSRDDVPYRALAEWARKALDGVYDRRAEEAHQRRESRRERKRAS